MLSITYLLSSIVMPSFEEIGTLFPEWAIKITSLRALDAIA